MLAAVGGQYVYRSPFYWVPTAYYELNVVAYSVGLDSCNLNDFVLFSFNLKSYAFLMLLYSFHNHLHFKFYF